MIKIAVYGPLPLTESIGHFLCLVQLFSVWSNGRRVHLPCIRFEPRDSATSGFLVPTRASGCTRRREASWAVVSRQ